MTRLTLKKRESGKRFRNLFGFVMVFSFFALLTHFANAQGTGHSSSSKSVSGDSVSPTEPSSPFAPEVSAPAASDKIRFLLTSKEKLLEGIPEDRGDSYLLTLPENKGGLQISKLDVAFIGTSRGSVFDFQRNRIQKGNPVETVKLAEWCAHNRLAAEGIAFLKESLASTTATETKEILQRQIDQMEYVERLKADANRRLAAAADEKKEEKAETDSEVRRLEAFGRQVPLSVQEKFSRRIQPILLRRCAVADCHQEGTPGTNFILVKNDRRGGIRKGNWRNMEMIFDHVDFNQSIASPILNHPAIEDAAGNRVYPFGDDQNSLKDYQLFHEWIGSAAAKMKDYRPDPNRPTVNIAGLIVENAGPSDRQTVDLTGTADGTDLTETSGPSAGDSAETAIPFGLNDEEMAELDQIMKTQSGDSASESAKPSERPPSVDSPDPSSPMSRTKDGTRPKMTAPAAKYRRVRPTDALSAIQSKGDRSPQSQDDVRDEFDPSVFNRQYHPEMTDAAPPSSPAEEESFPSTGDDFDQFSD